jgi:hypothetical protein
MKRLIQTVLATGAVVFIAGVSAAHAQVLETMKFSTTFPFTVGHKSFPAGNYTVRPLEGALDVMEISNGTSTTYFAVNPAEPRQLPTKDQVTFTKHGDEYALTRIWDSAEVSGVTPIQPKAASMHHHHS